MILPNPASSSLPGIASFKLSRSFLTCDRSMSQNSIKAFAGLFGALGSTGARFLFGLAVAAGVTGLLVGGEAVAGGGTGAVGSTSKSVSDKIDKSESEKILNSESECFSGAAFFCTSSSLRYRNLEC